jgi:hypothetical protein
MAENMILYDIIEEFIQNKCIYKKNNSFKINYHKNNSAQESLPFIYDDTNYIQCLIKPKDDLKNNDKDLKLIINDSSFELILYKNDNDLKTIKCILLLIINDYTVNDTEEANKFDEENIIDINNEEDLLEKTKLFLYNYIKQNKNKEKTLDKILLGDSTNNIRFFNNKDNKNFEEDIKKIKLCESNIQMKNFYDINNILDLLNPKLKQDLVNKFLDEMPEEISNLTKKYKNIKFNNEMYLNYVDYKNKIKEEENKEKNKDKENNNENENNEENKNTNTPRKKDKKEKKNKDDKNESDKKQLFQIK